MTTSQANNAKRNYILRRWGENAIFGMKMEIIFVTGKGGVGKSAVAASLAIKKAHEGKNTLLVELGNQSFYQDYFELREVSYKPVQLQKNLDVALWSGKECLKEYAQYLLKIESLYRLFFENKVTKTLIDVAPGLSELSIIGKITSGPPRNVGPKLNYNCIVVDAFSTGHFMALLRAPDGMAKAVRIGPMGDQSRKIKEVISDANICKYMVVSFPEELPVIEANELALQIQEQTGIAPIHILNKCLPFHSASEVESADFPLADFKNYLLQFMKRQGTAIEVLSKSGFEIKTLPWVYHHKPWSVVTELAKK